MKFCEWPIRSIDSRDTRGPTLLWTRAPFDAGGTLDKAVALLLPSQGVATPEQVAASVPMAAVDQTPCLGVWLGAPSTMASEIEEMLRAKKTDWVCNFPCSTMFDDHFGAQLAEVGLGQAAEIDALNLLKSNGLKTMFTLSAGEVPTSNIQADAILIVVRSALDLKVLDLAYIEALRTIVGPNLPIVVHGGRDKHLPHGLERLNVNAVLQTPI